MPANVATLPLVKGRRETKLDYRDNLPVNFIIVLEPVKGDKDGYMLSHDGLDEFAQVNGVARGGVFNERFNKHFRVSGTSIEAINADGSVDVLGVAGGDSTCSFASSFDTQLILAQGEVFLYDNVNVTKLIDPDLGLPVDVTWFRGIYVFTDGETIYQTNIGEETKIDPLKYKSSEFASDPTLGLARNDQNQVLAFNRYSIEYFYFNGNVPVGTSVLQVISGKAIQTGIVGTHCKCMLSGVFFIMGGRKDENISVHLIDGGKATRIASDEVDKIIGTYTESELSEVVMESRTDSLGKFVIIHLPNETLIYNHSASMRIGKDNAWSFVKTDIDVDSAWRGKHGVFDPRVAKWIYGDKLEGLLGSLSREHSAQYNEEIEGILYTPIVPAGQKSIPEFELSTISGFSNKTVTSAYSTSFDGIQYTQEYFNLVSEQYNYDIRYIARRIGYIRDDFNFKFRFVSTEKMAFSDLKVVIHG